jgi:hypothetical protein
LNPINSTDMTPVKLKLPVNMLFFCEPFVITAP